MLCYAMLCYAMLCYAMLGEPCCLWHNLAKFGKDSKDDTLSGHAKGIAVDC